MMRQKKTTPRTLFKEVADMSWDELAEEVIAHREGVLAQGSTEDAGRLIRLGWMPQTARVAVLLAQASPRTLHHDYMRSSLGIIHRQRKALAPQITWIRGLLGAEAVVSTPMVGYAMTPEGVQALRKLLGETDGN